MFSDGDAGALAVIPARAGSRRVPGKNVRWLLGRPALAYTIEAALESRLFASVVVSTDSEEIAAIANTYGAEVPYLRSPDLADDYVPVSAATVDALERVDPESRLYRYVAQLMATCPLRTATDLQASFRQFLEGGCRTQLSVTRFGWTNPWWSMRRLPTMELVPLFADAINERSQDLGELYCPTGAVWWATAEQLRRERTFHTPGRTGWDLPWYRAVDIDSEEDWQMVEVLMRLLRGDQAYARI